MSTFSLASTVSHHPTLPYKIIKEDILGKKYTVSLIFIGEKRARSLNLAYRTKSYVPNVLSFPADTDMGEIYICIPKAETESRRYEMTQKGFVGFLFIHGLLHLKGLDHGDTMTKAEDRYKKKYRFS